VGGAAADPNAAANCARSASGQPPPPRSGSGVSQTAASQASPSQTATLHGRVSSVECYGVVCRGQLNGSVSTPDGDSYNVSGTLDNGGHLEGTLVNVSRNEAGTPISQQLEALSGLLVANGQFVDITAQIVVPGRR
jgi:hypothetical protein